MWYARKRGEAAEGVTGSCRKKFSNIIPKGRPIRTAGRAGRTQEGEAFTHVRLY